MTCFFWNQYCILTFMQSHTCHQFRSSAQKMKQSATWLPGRWLNFEHLGPLLSNMNVVWPLGMLRCHIKPAACINIHLTPAEGPFLTSPCPPPHLDACHLIRETETWALSNLSASLHPSPLVLPPQLLPCHRNIFSHNYHFPFSGWGSVVFEMISEVKIFACVYLMRHIAAEVVLFCVIYSTVDGNVLPLCSREVKFSISWACQGWVPYKSPIVQIREQTLLQRYNTS